MTIYDNTLFSNSKKLSTICNIEIGKYGANRVKIKIENY